MKRSILIFVLFSFFFCGEVSALWTNKTMTFGGLTRSYRVYQSPNYNASDPASLVIALHGLGDNMTNFSGIGLNYIADTANIICIFPQAVSDPFVGAAWNSGAGMYGYYPNSGVNDIGFINALIDSAIASYSIDIHRVYLCGFSMGGFMTERMALQSNTRIAAFGSMSGTIGNGITNPAPGRHVPIVHFHGTADSTVLYTGNEYGMDAEALIDFWVNNNGCDTTPVLYSYPDVVADNMTVDRYEYTGSGPESDVCFFKIYNMGHTALYQPNNDMTEVVELWLFLRRHSLATAGTDLQPASLLNMQVFPNPAGRYLNVVLPQSSELLTLTIYNVAGSLIWAQTTAGGPVIVDLDNCKMSQGIYLLHVSGPGLNLSQKFIKE